jgi:hypothetical protein
LFPFSGPTGNRSTGSAEKKMSFKQAVDQLGSPGIMRAADVVVWDKLLQDSVFSIQDIFSLLHTEDIRKLREDSPTNLSTLCYKV